MPSEKYEFDELEDPLTIILPIHLTGKQKYSKICIPKATSDYLKFEKGDMLRITIHGVIRLIQGVS